ncbi:hypothetical protein FRC19_002356, partial [Serendipita sp. 401]
FESEALNDEARRWMADFLLYPIGKRTRSIGGTTRLLGKSKLRAHQNVTKNLVCIVCGHKWESLYIEVVLKRYRPYSAMTDGCGQFCEVQLLPKSDDTFRLSRFRVLVDVFHRGYQGDILDKNIASRSNTVLLDRRWIPMFDNGAFHLRYDDGQVSTSKIVYESMTDTSLGLCCSVVGHSNRTHPSMPSNKP